MTLTTLRHRRCHTTRRRFAAAFPAASVTVAVLHAALSTMVSAQDASPGPAADKASQSLTILVADPLAKELACGCVAGFAQRRYEALAMVLEKRLGRPVNSLCGTQLSAFWSDDQPVALIVGKHSDLVFQARQLGRKLYPIASLTDSEGATTFRGLFVVRSGNRAKSIADLQGYRLLLGPASCAEKHGAALTALGESGIVLPHADQRTTFENCTDAANELMKLADQDAAVAAISDYAKVLLDGCHTIPKDSLRVIGQTAPLPFVTVFATEEVSPAMRTRIRQELLAARQFPTLLRLLESKEGFRTFAQLGQSEPDDLSWHDFRGANRDALVPTLPKSLDTMRTLWAAPLDGRGLGGIAVTDRWVLATDRNEDRRVNYLKLFDVATGTLRFAGELVDPHGLRNSRNLDYGNSIRTTPLVDDSTVYLLDPFGALFRWTIPESDSLADREVIIGTNTALLLDDFELVTWGLSSTPMLVSSSDGQRRLIINTCSANNTVLALDLESLTMHWQGAGKSTGYASCIAGTYGSRPQIVGYDNQSLGGWDLDTGRRLWTVKPEFKGDFNVPTPIALDDHHLLVVTETNGMRIYAFDDQGVLHNEPAAINEDVATDTVTPVAVAGKAYCTSDGTLFQLDTQHGLQVTWSMPDQAFRAHVSLIADRPGQRLLVTNYAGELLLFDIAGDQPVLLSRRHAFDPNLREEVYSHPSLVGNRYYIRGLHTLKCLEF